MIHVSLAKNFIFFLNDLRTVIIAHNAFLENVFNRLQRRIFVDLCLPRRKNNDIKALSKFVREAKITSHHKTIAIDRYYR